MIAGIELAKQYLQICVKTETMKEPESIAKIVGSEQYRIPIEADLDKKEDLKEVFRKIWKMISPYGTKAALEYLVFCLEENTEQRRADLWEIAELYEIPRKKVCFLDKGECFCAYVMQQQADLFSYNALLIENVEGKKEPFLLHRQSKTVPLTAQVRNISEKSLEQIFKEHMISSVFLVGDDFEEDWIEENKPILKKGRRVFVGKNLFVKGAVFRGMELAEKNEEYIYLGAEKLHCHIGLKIEKEGQETEMILAQGGSSWYEADVSMELLLLNDRQLEFSIIPLNSQERKMMQVSLDNFPNRPPKTTRVHMELKFQNACTAKILIRDLGFGEIFPQSDMIYEGELGWEQ